MIIYSHGKGSDHPEMNIPNCAPIAVPSDDATVGAAGRLVAKCRDSAPVIQPCQFISNNVGEDARAIAL
jgi:hypothetical protein